MLENEKTQAAENNSTKKAQVGEAKLSGLTMNERIDRVRARRMAMTLELSVPDRIERIRSQMGLTRTGCPF
jgi:hypothetical protein